MLSECAGGPHTGTATRIASVEAQFAARQRLVYSPVVKAESLLWTKENPNKFLAAPKKVIPNTRRVIATPDAMRRAALFSYLFMPK